MNCNNPKGKHLIEYQSNTDKILFYGSEYKRVLVRDIRIPFGEKF